MKLKMNTALAKLEYLATQFKAMMSDYTQFFKTKQGSFKGIRKTFSPREGFPDQPDMSKVTLVVTTVDEKIQYFYENVEEYIDLLFRQEATNAQGHKVPLVVDGKTLGEFSALELLRLKSFLENGDFTNMISNIPVRSDNEIWTLVDPKHDLYGERETIFQNNLQLGVTRSSETYAVILEDPNIGKLKDTGAYKPVTDSRKKTVETGDYTLQEFSGEWSHHQRAYVLKRKAALVAAVIQALKEVNDIEVAQSEMTGKKLLNYLFFGEVN